MSELSIREISDNVRSSARKIADGLNCRLASTLEESLMQLPISQSQKEVSDKARVAMCLLLPKYSEDIVEFKPTINPFYLVGFSSTGDPSLLVLPVTFTFPRDEALPDEYFSSLVAVYRLSRRR